MSEKKQRFVTPIGEARWAWLNKPKTFKDENGNEKAPKYQIEVYFDPTNPEWKEWATGIRAMADAVPATIDKNTGNPMPKQYPIKWELDEHDQKTGKLYAIFRTGDQYRPKVFDADVAPLGENVLVGNGSKVRVNYVPNAFKAFGGGVNLYLNAVQVLDLVPYESRSGASFGFEPVAAAGGVPKAQPEDDLPF